MKRILSLLLAAVLMISSVPLTASAEELFPAGGSGETELLSQPVSAGAGEADISDVGMEPEAGETDISDAESELEAGPAAGSFAMASDEIATFDDGGTVAVTRLQWLNALTTVFEMTVEADNYPDKYFTDLDALFEEDYRKVMVATEFGLVDVEAGDPMRPNDAATREFAAHTLNLCMGYQPEEGVTYTFSEAASVTYPDDIQIAIDKGWFALSGGAFLPEQGITVAEKDAMIAAAEAAIAETKIDPNHENTYQVLPGVRVIPEGTEIALTDDNELTFYNYAGEIAQGDIFVVVSDGLPIARRALEVTVNGGTKIVKVGSVETEEAFSAIDVQGTMDVDLTRIQALDAGVSLAYIVGGTEELEYEDGVTYYSLYDVPEQEEVNAVIATKTLPDTGYDEINHFEDTSVSVGRGSAKVSCKISNIKPEYKVVGENAYVKVSGTVTFTFGTNGDTIELTDYVYPFVKVPIGWVGFFEPSAVGEIKGSVSLSLKNKVSIGMEYANGKKRLLFDFKKESFTLDAKAEVKVGIKVATGIDVVVARAELYFEGGAKGTAKLTKHLDGGRPELCMHFEAHMYANAGGKVVFNLLNRKIEVKQEKELYNAKNSPVKIALHYEDGKKVSKCSRGNPGGGGSGGGSGSGSGGLGDYKYYTPFDSQYAYNGVNSGTGTDGQAYQVFEYTLDDKNFATITKYNGNAAAVNIPQTVDEYTVKAIGSNVFQNNTKISLVVIPDTVTEIDWNAFDGCTSLSNVTLSKNLQVLGACAFGRCTALTEIEIPKSLLSAGYNMYYEGPFYGCTNLKTVTFEEGTVRIAPRLFSLCVGIENIEVPETVTVIGEDAFYSAVNLKNVIMHDAVITIEGSAFEKCSSIKRITLPANLKTLGGGAFRDCTYLEEIVIPDTVTEIDWNAFDGCTSLSNVTLSKNLQVLGACAFGGCTALTEIEIPKSLLSAGYNMYYEGPFYGCTNLKTVTFEEGTVRIAPRLFSLCAGIENIEVPETVTVIGEDAFYSATNLKDVIIHDAVITIEGSAFEKCSSIKRITLPANLKTLGGGVFRDCTYLEEIVIPDTVTEIGWNAFDGCTALSNVTLSKNLQALDDHAFGGCTALTEIEIPKSLLSAGYNMYYEGPFYGCTNLKTVTFEEGTVRIAPRLFSLCAGIENIEVPETVTVIGESAFYGAANLKTVSLQSGLLTIEGGAFRNASSLQEITIPDTVNSIGNYAFRDCTYLTKVHLPNGLQNIPYYGFCNCEKLSEINIPDTVTEIEEYAFDGCKALPAVTLPQNLQVIGRYAFRNCDALTEITIPDTVTRIGEYCFYDCELLSGVTLGTGITEIPEYCFYQCPVQAVLIPYRVRMIRSYAFSNCVSLTEVTLPRAVTEIESDVFSYPSKMTIYGVKGTYAETYANENNITFVNKETHATEVSFHKTELKINSGQTDTLILSINPVGFTDEVIWKSSNESVATVTEDGVVSAWDIGEATIRVTVGSLSASCKVKVVQPVLYIRLDEYELSLMATDTFRLTAEVYPSDAENREVEWSTSDAAVASVTQDGLVTAISKGTATITVRAKDGSGEYDCCTVTVTGSAHIATSVEQLESAHNYDNDSQDIWKYTVPGQTSLKVTFDSRTEVEEDFDFLYIYDGSNQQVGKYTGKELAGKTVNVPGDTVVIKLVADKAGNAWGFKVTSVNGSGTTPQNPTDPTDPTNPTNPIDPTNPTNPTDPTDLTTPTDPTNPTDPTDSTNPTDPQTPEDPAKPAGVPVTRIKLNKTSLVLLAGETETLTATVEPSDADNKAVVWSSGDPSVATVDASTGLVTAVKAGTAKITATAADGSKVFATCDVTVKSPVSGSLWIADIPDQIYTGTAIKPELQVYFGSVALVADVDYTVSYKNNIKAASETDSKAPVAMVKGKGNYSGTAACKFNINRIPIAETALASSVFPAGMAYTPVITYTADDTIIVLKMGTDYTVKYDGGTATQPKAAGAHTMTVIGKGNCEGSVTFDYTIGDTGRSIAKAVAKVGAMTYGGSLPTASLKLDGADLKEDKDYLVAFSNLGKKGSGKATFIGIGEYFGTKTVSFKISAAKITAADVSVDSRSSYVKGGAKAAVTVEVGDRLLVPGVDYTVSYSGNKKLGSAAKATIKGKGNYSGTVKKDFTVTSKDLSDEGVQIFVSDAQKGKKPAVTIYDTNGAKLSQGSDYKVSQNPESATVTITGGSNRLYESAGIEETYREVEKGKLITSAKLKKGYTSFAYTGEPITLEEEWLEVKAGKSPLDSSNFEIVGYVNNVKKGTAVAVIRAKEDSEYGGLKFVSFKIATYNFSKAR